ncbi:helix-turn-helix transcriptional regulator [Lachnospiraceae bacterium NSJ-143]|nr:helix-turn-helix transcriptional regulator [Lachnospiraceae bacterium NSJ-143]
MEYGILSLKINDLLKQKNISKNVLCSKMDIPHHSLNRYCRNEFKRIDTVLVCKLCFYFNISISDLIEYLPPER